MGRWKISHIFGTMKGLQISNFVHGWHMTTHITDMRSDLKGQG